MKHIRTQTLARKMSLPIYSISEKKVAQKSCFIDSNREDTVKAAQAEKEKKDFEPSV